LVVFPDRMRANLEPGEGELVAERLNALLAPALGKAAAKKLLARLSAEAAATAAEDGPGAPFAERLAAVPEAAGLFTGPGAPKDLLEPSGYLGAAGILADRVLARHTAR
ncbi:3-carboxy-cis,cis-muconate cycloisomerase, partial [Streptomyces anulatus]